MANAVPTIMGYKKTVAKQPLPIVANEMSAAVASGGAATVVFTCPSDRNVAIACLDFGYRVAPTAGSIQISDGTLTWGPFTVVLAGLQTRTFDPPLLFTKGANVTVTMADGGQIKDLYAKGIVEGASPY